MSASPYRGDGEIREVLICAGLDPSGGAGLIADVRVVAQLGARPVGVVTALTVQNTQAVQQSTAVDGEIVGAQLAALLGDIEVHAVKLGMLGSLAIAREISYGLDLTKAPVVWDPVGAPSRGSAELDATFLEEALGLLAPHLTLVTPNIRELAQLARWEITDRASAVTAGEALAHRIGVPVLVKGGHLDDETAIDTLVLGPDDVREIGGPRIGRGEDVHGTGCALSTAIATYLAKGLELDDACREAKAFVASRIAAPVSPGRGAPAVV